MKTRIHKKALIFFMLILLAGWVNASGVYLEVSGWVRKDGESVRHALITVWEGDSQIREIKSNRLGNFYLQLPTSSEYTLVVSAEGAMDKNIVLNTVTEVSLKADKDYFIEFVVDVYDAENSPESVFLKHQFVYDPLHDDFMYLQPNVSEHLKNENEERVSFGNIGCCERDEIVS